MPRLAADSRNSLREIETRGRGSDHEHVVVGVADNVADDGGFVEVTFTDDCFVDVTSPDDNHAP